MRPLIILLVVGCEPEPTGLTEDKYWSQLRIASCEAAVHCPDTDFYGKTAEECLAVPSGGGEQQVEAGFLVCYDSKLACECLAAVRAIGPGCTSLRDEWPEVCDDVYQLAALIHDNQIEARCEFEDD